MWVALVGAGRGRFSQQSLTTGINLPLKPALAIASAKAGFSVHHSSLGHYLNSQEQCLNLSG
jgi:hypothetical protein